MKKEEKFWIEEQFYGAPKDRNEALREYLVGYVLRQLEKERGLSVKAEAASEEAAGGGAN